jgi:hypothetical protein
VVKAALASYVASQDTAGEALRIPILAFSLTYLAAHHALGLISEHQAMRTMDSLEALYGSGRALRKAAANNEYLTRSATARRREPRS